ncbi:hypothetical protein [Micromonospora sp. WMMD980]|uniref:hypothetical protein n=1 Tax=Micromonospora sp. WMMD980 TaxID=3016088 RepID=UPI0032422AF9
MGTGKQGESWLGTRVALYRDTEEAIVMTSADGGAPPSREGSRAWVATAQGSHLRGRRTRDTAPEMALRRAVHALGLRFRLGRTLFNRCRPDLVFPGRSLSSQLRHFLDFV